MKIPPLPKWDPAIDGLEDPSRWALEYERSQLPPDTVFPRKGQIWEAIWDCDVGFVAWINAGPMAGGMEWLKQKQMVMTPGSLMSGPLTGGRARLRKGERVRILDVDGPKPLLVNFKPLRYEELHENIVPEHIRRRPGYSHYVLTVRTARTVCSLREEMDCFNEVFRLIEDVA